MSSPFRLTKENLRDSFEFFAVAPQLPLGSESTDSNRSCYGVFTTSSLLTTMAHSASSTTNSGPLSESPALAVSSKSESPKSESEHPIAEEWKKWSVRTLDAILTSIIV